MSSVSEDIKAVSCGLFTLAATSFALATSVSLLSMANGYFLNPEDTVWCSIPPFSLITPPADKCKTGTSTMPGAVARAKAAHRNHTENAVMLAAFYLVYAWSGADNETARTTIFLSAGMRVLYGPLYILELAPWRTITHLVAGQAGVMVGYEGLSKMFAMK